MRTIVRLTVALAAIGLLAVALWGRTAGIDRPPEEETRAGARR